MTQNIEPHRTALQARAERLLKAGLLGADDLDLVEALVRTQRAGEAAELLDLIERAENKRW